mgnify:CR=1 FL=1
MALTESSVISQITILEDGQIQVRRSRRVYDGAEMIAEQYHRHVVLPGDNVVGEDPRVRAVARVLHTPEVIAAWKAAHPLS